VAPQLGQSWRRSANAPPSTHWLKHRIYARTVSRLVGSVVSSPALFDFGEVWLAASLITGAPSMTRREEAASFGLPWRLKLLPALGLPQRHATMCKVHPLPRAGARLGREEGLDAG
jgi:hypothetical protein